MPAIGFTPIETEVLARLGNRTDIGARVGRWINLAFLELLTNPRFSFYELETSSAFLTEIGENSYNLSGQILIFDGNTQRGIVDVLWVITSIYDETNRQILHKSHMREMEKRGSSYDYTIYGNSQGLGKPNYYTRSDNTLFLYPVPDGIYTLNIRYLQRPDEQRAGTDFMGIGTEWEDLIVSLASLKGFIALGQTDRAMEIRQHMEQLMSIREESVKLDDANTEYGIEPELTQS